jgi:hypothetical protein
VVPILRGAEEAAEKRVITVSFMEKPPSAAKADFDLIGFISTTEVVPFQTGVSDCVFPQPVKPHAPS